MTRVNKPAPKRPAVDRDKVLAFRLQAHHLARRLPAGSLVEAAAACGIQNTPPGSAALALHARVADLSPSDLERALAIDKMLLQVWGMRASPYLVPTADAGIFTAGLLPEDEASTLFYILGAGAHLDLFGMRAIELVRRTAAELLQVLDGRELTKDELGVEISRRLARDVKPQQLALWNKPDGLTHYGETLVRFALSVVALHGLFCIAPRTRKVTTFVRTDQWLGAPLPGLDPRQARAGLVRRYLACYGPSTSAHFAQWTGISPEQAGRAWQLVEPDLVQIDWRGKAAWLHPEDWPRFQAPQEPKGVRLLPPHDPYLALRDRETLVPDKKLHPRLWRTVGNPGAVLADGEIVATWRPQKKGTRLVITISPLTRIGKQVRSEVENEAESLAPFRDCASVEVKYEE